jgi:protein SCO1/2
MRTPAALLTLFALPLAVLVGSPAAQAGLTERQLAGVAADPAPGARLALGTIVQDVRGPDLTLGEAMGGRPALLVPVDYRCRSLCGPALALLGPILSQTGRRLGRDYAVLVLGMDPHDGEADALAMATAQLGDIAAAPGLRLLTARAGALDAIFAALGYRTTFDKQAGRFAHPAAAFALAPDGRVVRTLSTLALDATDLDLALTESAGGSGSIGERLVLLCYGFDPVHGIYTPAIRRGLAAAGAATLLALAAGIAGLARRSRRSKGAS